MKLFLAEPLGAENSGLLNRSSIELVFRDIYSG